MKIKDVPQDKGYLQNGKLKELCYAVDEDGTYRQVLSIGWKPKNEAMELANKLIEEKAENIRQDVINGKLSPIAYFMEINIMDIKLLAQYTGFSRRKVRKHLTPEAFSGLNESDLEKYATIFNLHIKDLTDIEKLKNKTTNNPAIDK